MKYIDVKTLEIAGFRSALETLRLPYGKECRSVTNFALCDDYNVDDDKIISTSTIVDIHSKDMELLKTLIKRGDEHAKALRLVQVWANITAPRYFWQEMVTYEVGVTKGCSNSTMHQECKGMSTEELVKAKDELKEGTMQTRTYMFSYQALRRIYFQRRNHRLPHWKEFCEWIETLPMASEFITLEGCAQCK